MKLKKEKRKTPKEQYEYWKEQADLAKPGTDKDAFTEYAKRFKEMCE